MIEKAISLIKEEVDKLVTYSKSCIVIPEGIVPNVILKTLEGEYGFDIQVGVDRVGDSDFIYSAKATWNDENFIIYYNMYNGGAKIERI